MLLAVSVRRMMYHMSYWSARLAGLGRAASAPAVAGAVSVVGLEPEAALGSRLTAGAVVRRTPASPVGGSTAVRSSLVAGGRVVESYQTLLPPVSAGAEHWRARKKRKIQEGKSAPVPAGMCGQSWSCRP